MKNIGCYIYTRISTAIQVDGYSLDAQKEKLRKYAEYQNYKVIKEFSDEGKSGKSIEGRPSFQDMVKEIENRVDDVEFVLVFKLSRFGRNAADVLNSLQLMQDYEVKLIWVEDGIDSSKDSGKLMISVLSSVAEIERENILVQTVENLWWAMSVERREKTERFTKTISITPASTEAFTMVIDATIENSGMKNLLIMQ